MSNLAFGFKANYKLPIKRSIKPKKISSKVKGVVVRRDNILCVIVDNDIHKCYPLTEESYNPKGRKFLFRNRVEKGKHVLRILNDEEIQYLEPTKDAYFTLKEGCVIMGHIHRLAGKDYFNYEEFLGPNENQIINKD